MISGFVIGGKVWLVRTKQAAEFAMPQTLPMGSIVLTPDEAVRLGSQILAAGQKAALSGVVG
jgi:hypothetical protein